MSVTVPKTLQSVSSIRCVEPRFTLSRFKPILMATAVVIGTISQSGAAFALTQLVSAQCSTNPVSEVQNVYYVNTPPETGTQINKEISIPMNSGQPVMKPFWDFRYVNPVAQTPLTTYYNHADYSGINATSSSEAKGWGTSAATYDNSGSLVQVKCVNGYLAASAMVNGWDSLRIVTYGGPQATWTYLFVNATGGVATAPRPWANGTNNLILQGEFIQPYHTFGVVGAEVNFNVILRKTTEPIRSLNYVISTHRSNGDFSEKGFDFDPTTYLEYISTLVKHPTDVNLPAWVTKSPASQPAAVMRNSLQGLNEAWPYFYRVNITSSDLYEALVAIPIAEGYGTNPSEWMVTSVGVQTEFTGPFDQSVGSSVRAFEVYSHTGPL